jgi:sulfate permease, SulP family
MFALKPAELRTNVLSGLTVCLALVPEAIAFALVAHVSPLTGLYAALIVCLITAALGGRPGMISGAIGALAVVMVITTMRIRTTTSRIINWDRSSIGAN